MTNTCPGENRSRSHKSDVDILNSLADLKKRDFDAFLEALANKVSKLPAHPDAETGWWCAHHTLMKQLIPYLADEPSPQRLAFRDHFRTVVADQISSCRQCCARYYRAILEFELEDHDDNYKLACRRLRALVNWDVGRLLPKLRRLSREVRATGSGDSRQLFVERNSLLEAMHSFRICINQDVSLVIGEVLSRATPVDIRDVVPVVKIFEGIPSGLLVLCFHQKPAVNSWAQRLCTQLSKVRHPHRESAYTVLQKVAKQFEKSSFGDSAKSGNSGYAPDKRTGWHGFGTIFSCLDDVAVLGLCSRFNSIRLFKIFSDAISDIDDDVVIRSATCMLRLFGFVHSKCLFTSELTPERLLGYIMASLRQGRRQLTQQRLLDTIAPTISRARNVYDQEGVCRLFRMAFEFLYGESQCGRQKSLDQTAISSTSAKDRTSLDRRAILKSGARLLETFYSQSAPALPIRNSAMVSKFVMTVLREDSKNERNWNLLRVVLMTDAFNLLQAVLYSTGAKEIASIYPLRRSENLISRGEEAKVIQKFKELPVSTQNENSWVFPLWKGLREGRHSPSETDGEVQASEHEVRILLDLHMVIGMVDHARVEELAERNLSTREDKDGRLMKDPSRADTGRVSFSDRLSYMQSTISDRFFLACQNSGAQKWWNELPFHATHLLASARKEVSHKGFAALRKSKNILGASCFGSQSKLLASVVKNDAEGAKMMASGCYAAMRIIDALGSNSSIRTFPSVMLWYRVLLESTYNDLFESGDQTCAVGVIVVFVRNWRRFEQSTEASVFREVCCRLFSNLRDVWDRFLVLEPDDNADSYMNADGREAGLRKALSGIISMNKLKDSCTRGAWVNLICNVAESWRNNGFLRELMVMAIQYHESNRGMLSYDQCLRIKEAAGLSEIDVTLHRWSKEDESKMAPKNDKPRKLETTTIDQFFGPVLQGDTMVRAVVERKSSNTPFIGKGFASKDIRSLKPPSNVRSIRAPGQSSALFELRRDARAVKKTKLKKETRAAATNRAAEGGKTAFELLVAKNQAERKERRAGQAPNGSVDPDEGIQGGLRKRPAVVSKTSKRVHGPVIAIDTEVDEIAAAKERFSLPSYRRYLQPRDKERIYRDILVTHQRALRLPAGGPVNNSWHKYKDVEEYVGYWEPFVVSEFQESLHQTITEEKMLWERESVKNSFSSWRASFEVEGPVESVGYMQNISLRFCDDEPPPYTKGRSDQSDFEMSRIQVSDIVLMFIPPPKFVKKTVGRNEIFTTLGLVMNVVRKPSEFVLNLKVAFEQLDKAPGRGRQIKVVRLTGTATFNRQLDALWSLPNVCDGILRTVLEPRVGVDINKDVCKEQMKLFESAIAPRSRFLEDMAGRRILNDGQKETISEVLKSCSPLFRPHGKGRFQCDHVEDHGSFTMIQGPPGTGKTSTIIALMSALLLPRAQDRPYKNVRIGVDNCFSVVQVPKIRILVCAPSNAAVDEIMLRVMEEGLFTTGGFRASPFMVRVGGGTTNDALKPFEVWDIVERKMASTRPPTDGNSVASARIRNLQSELATVNSKIGDADKERQNCDLRRDMEVPRDSKGKSVKRKGKKSYSELTEVLTALHNQKRVINRKLSEARAVQKDVNAARKKEQTMVAAGILNGCSVAFATLSSSGHELMRTVGARFDVIIVDEAAQCCEPELIIPVACSNSAKNRKVAASHLVLVGDPRQLPATVLSADRNVQEALGMSLFERVASNSSSSVHMLRTQYRMHPAISLFPSSHFYNGLLINGENVRSKKVHQSFHLDKQLRFGPLSFFDTSQTYSKEVRTAGGSLSNSAEAKIVVAAIASLVQFYRQENFRDKIVVLSPYKQQVNLLKRLVSETRALNGMAVEVSTIDGIQGREKSIVFLSTVRSGHGRGIGFVDDDRRMNVAITRARHSLIIFGHATALSQGSRLWDSLISHCRARSLITNLPQEATSIFPESNRHATVHVAPSLPPLAELPDVTDSGRIELQDARKGRPAPSKSVPTRGIALRSQLPSPPPAELGKKPENKSGLQETSQRTSIGVERIQSNRTGSKESIDTGRKERIESVPGDLNEQITEHDQPEATSTLKREVKVEDRFFSRGSSRHISVKASDALPIIPCELRPASRSEKEEAFAEIPRDASMQKLSPQQFHPAKRPLRENVRKMVENSGESSTKRARMSRTPELDGYTRRTATRMDTEMLSDPITERPTNPSSSRMDISRRECRKTPSEVRDAHVLEAQNGETVGAQKDKGRRGRHGSRSRESSEQGHEQYERKFDGQREDSAPWISENQKVHSWEQTQERRTVFERLGSSASQPHPRSLKKPRSSPDHIDRVPEVNEYRRRGTSASSTSPGQTRPLKVSRRSANSYDESAAKSKKEISQRVLPKKSPPNPASQGGSVSRRRAGHGSAARPPQTLSAQSRMRSLPRQRVGNGQPLSHVAGRQVPQPSSTLRSRSSETKRRSDRAAMESRLIANSKGKKRSCFDQVRDKETVPKKQRIAAQGSGQHAGQSQRKHEDNRRQMPSLARLQEQMKQTNAMKRMN